MPKIKGKLPDGISGFLEIVDDAVILWAEKGIISKGLVKLTEFPVSEATSTHLAKNQAPFRYMHKLTINYGVEAGESEVVFFSDDEASLDAVKNEVDGDIEKRRLAKELELAECRRVRETHVHQITLILELLDQVFQIIFELDEGVNWKLVRECLSEIKQILREMIKVDADIPFSYDVQGLSTSIRLRQTGGIKDECYAIIESVHGDVGRLLNTGESPEGFNIELYELFVKSYLLLWDLNLGEYVGDGLEKDELKALQSSLEKLDGLVQYNEYGGGLEQVKDLLLVKTFSPHFKKIRSLIHIYLNSLIE
jgi:hypothetical protein